MLHLWAQLGAPSELRASPPPECAVHRMDASIRLPKMLIAK
jgi:hypothetical protein